VSRPKGSPKYGGRKKGTPNKFTADVREAVRNAFDRLGGEDYLVALGKRDSKTFMGAFNRIIPQHHTADVTITHEQALKMLDDEEKSDG